MTHYKQRLVALVIVWMLAAVSHSQGLSPDGVFARFCDLDVHGAQLTSDGWEKVAALFVNPGKPRRERIIVADRTEPLRSTPEGEKFGVGREYIRLGQIKLPQVRFSAEEPGVRIVEMGPLYVIRVPGLGGTTEWRIEGPVPHPVVNVEAAIRYVTAVVQTTQDAAIKKDAEHTLAALKRLR